jgi:hypothetical protein
VVAWAGIIGCWKEQVCVSFRSIWAFIRGNEEPRQAMGGRSCRVRGWVEPTDAKAGEGGTINIAEVGMSGESDIDLEAQSLPRVPMGSWVSWVY